MANIREIFHRFSILFNNSKKIFIFFIFKIIGSSEDERKIIIIEQIL